MSSVWRRGGPQRQNQQQEQHEAGVELWFQNPIYVVNNVLAEDEIKNLIEYCNQIKIQYGLSNQQWESNVNTTFGRYDPAEDEKFKNLFNNIDKHVQQFASAYESYEPYENNGSWLNFNSRDQYQEIHIHPESIFSAVFFLQAPENSGNLFFKDPRLDMIPVKKPKEENFLNYEKVFYKPEPNKLVIFRSYLPHGVTLGENEKDRISLAVNYK
jgi:uncharacterized protein (TIGR02466 family)